MTHLPLVVVRTALARANRTFLVAAILTGMVTATACGGGGDGTTEQPQPVITSITVTPGTLALLTGNTGTLSATVAPAGVNGAMTWTSSVPSVATVSGSGTSATVTAVAAGTATIRATSTSNAAVSGTMTVTVTAPVVATLTLSVTTLTLVPGQPATPIATARDAAGVVIAGAPITWTSTSNAVATVASDGRVTGASPGSAVITARSGDATATLSAIVNDGGYVAPTGGTITALNGTLVITVASGGVTTPTAVTVRRNTTAPPNARLLAGTAVEIESSPAFTTPPHLSLAYPSALAPDVVEAQLRLAQLANNAWQEADVEMVNRTAHLVSAPMTNSGTWAVFVPPPSLRSYAQLKGIDIGGELNVPELRADLVFRRVLGGEFSTLTAGNELKWDATQPSPTSFTFGPADEIVNFAVANGMRVHGHNLLWHSQAPAWIQASTQTRTTMLAALKNHIETVVGRYVGRIATWDVANEVIADNQTGLRSSFWVNVAGPDIIDSAFVWARRTDPSAKLFINDYSVEVVNAKSDSLLAFATRLKARGVPIDGIGLQSHFLVGSPSLTALKTNIDRMAAAGFDIRITELDVRIADGTDNLAAQATIYANTMGACLAQPRCKAVTTWGVTDKYSWIPSFFPGYGRALMFDANFQPKPAYTSLRDLLSRP